jgi:hypothetical protein
MTASDEFPRGGFFGTGNSANPSPIVLPATPGIAHVLSGVRCTVYNQTASGQVRNISATDGTNLVELGVVVMGPGSPGTTTSVDKLDWSGKIHFAIGASVTIQIEGGLAANMGGELDADWYDI